MYCLYREATRFVDGKVIKVRLLPYHRNFEHSLRSGSIISLGSIIFHEEDTGDISLIYKVGLLYRNNMQTLDKIVHNIHYTLILVH